MTVHLDAVNSTLLANDIKRLPTGDIVGLHQREALAGWIHDGQGNSDAAMLRPYREELTGGQRELIRVDLFGAERLIHRCGRFQSTADFRIYPSAPCSCRSVEPQHGCGGERKKMP